MLFSYNSIFYIYGSRIWKYILNFILFWPSVVIHKKVLTISQAKGKGKTKFHVYIKPQQKDCNYSLSKANAHILNWNLQRIIFNLFFHCMTKTRQCFFIKIYYFLKWFTIFNKLEIVRLSLFSFLKEYLFMYIHNFYVPLKAVSFLQKVKSFMWYLTWKNIVEVTRL